MSLKKCLFRKFSLILALAIIYAPAALALTPVIPPHAGPTVTIEADFSKQGFSAPSAIYGWSQEIDTPFDAASGLPTGRTKHLPLVVNKPFDNLSLMLYNGIFTNENIKSLIIRNFSNNKPISTIKLTNAQVVKVIGQDNQDNQNNKSAISDKFEFVYQKIEIINESTGAIAEGDWEPRI